MRRGVDRLLHEWKAALREDHAAAGRLSGIEAKLARMRATTREALINQLERALIEEKARG